MAKPHGGACRWGSQTMFWDTRTRGRSPWLELNRDGTRNRTAQVIRLDCDLQQGSSKSSWGPLCRQDRQNVEVVEVGEGECG